MHLGTPWYALTTDDNPQEDIGAAYEGQGHSNLVLLSSGNPVPVPSTLSLER